MKSKFFMTWAALRWVLLMFLVAPGLEAPLIAHSEAAIKPIRVWSGLASWYGPKFQGRATANGEHYDMTGFTAAHATLPFGSLVRVTNPRTGRSAVVRINDRGPFVEGRELDVSYQAATRLGLVSRGVARLKIELLEVPERRAPRP
jgi:rare lipoprotein A